MDTREDRHIDDGALLALLDGELAIEERRTVETHTDRCSECAGRRDTLRFESRRVAAALEAEDATSPWTDMPEALRIAMDRAPTPITQAPSARVGRSGRRSVVAAAGLTLVLAAGAYAIPGSPVRGWIDGGIEAIASLMGGDEAPEATPGPSSASVEPVDGEVRVSVLGAAQGLLVRIALSEESAAAASAEGANFHIGTGVIEVTGATGDLSVTLPRDAVTGSVEVDGVEVARLENGALTRTPGADASPAEILVQTGG